MVVPAVLALATSAPGKPKQRTLLGKRVTGQALEKKTHPVSRGGSRRHEEER